MAISKKYLSLEEAAGMLKLKNDELVRLREKGEIRGFADRGTWKFKADDVEEFRRRRQPDSDPDVPIMNDDDLGERLMSDPDLQTFSASENALDDDDEFGRQPTVIRKGRESSSDSDVRLVFDEGLRGRLTGSSGELPVLDLGKSDSDVRLVGDSAPRLKPDSDSDVKLVNPMGQAPDSDSDVKLVSPSGMGAGPKLSESDSDVRLAPLSGSDSDVKLVVGRGSSARRLSEASTDGDIQLAPLSGDMKSVAGHGSSVSRSGSSTDSDVALLTSLSEPMAGDRGGMAFDLDQTDEGPGASALFDADDDSSIVLPGDSGIRLSGDSGIQLRQPADSGILLEGADSGIQLGRGDSGMRLGGDSGFRLAPTGGSSKMLKGGSSKNLKGRKAADDLDSTSPMLSIQDDDDLNMTSPMLLGADDDDLSSTDLEMSMLSDDAGGSGAKRGAVVMFDDDDADDATGTLAKKRGKKSGGDSEFDFDDEVSAEDDELEVSDEVLGEDDELEDLDAFDSDDDEFDESFETGASQIGFGRRQDKVVVPQEAEWGTGFFLGLLASSFVLMAGALLSVDLLHTTWAGNESAVYQGELIGLFAGLFR